MTIHRSPSRTTLLAATMLAVPLALAPVFIAPAHARRMYKKYGIQRSVLLPISSTCLLYTRCV